MSLGSRKEEASAEEESDFKKEVVVKSGVISVKDEVASRGPEDFGQDRSFGIDRQGER